MTAGDVGLIALLRCVGNVSGRKSLRLWLGRLILVAAVAVVFFFTVPVAFAVLFFAV
jgi:hypothetical protein